MKSTPPFLLLLSVLAGALPACTSETLSPGCNDLGNSELAVRVSGVLSSAQRFDASSAAVSDELAAVCAQMAVDLGIDPLGGNDPQANCDAVRTEIDAIQAELAGSGSITLTAEPPRCYVSARASADCISDCDVNYDASAALTCEGGEVRGMCDAECSGTCYIEGEITCASVCNGTCSGTCTGACNGTCDGTCSLMDAEGRCIGECDGTCEGRCDAECSGTCTGTCAANVEGSCTGICEGSCTTEFVEPSCTGGGNVSADAECRAACDAELSAEATCDPPIVSVVATGVTSDSRAARLVYMLQLRWGDFLAVATKLEGVAASGQMLASSLGSLAGSVSELGVQAGACLSVAADSAVSAVADVQVSVSVSVELEGSVGAGA